tara:strand:+ start:4950 stop:5648 length:699 start_codon:yes stop_codon:yes gene_type:complete
MGSRKKNASERNTKTRYSGDIVLIICEGTQTEPNYLIELKDFLYLDKAAIHIVPSEGSAPNSVVKHAKDAIKGACNKGNPYSKVYCVIDKDQHPTYASALQAIKDFNESTRKKCDTIICPITSVPCFEYWILMHYSRSTQSFGTSGHSPCGQLIRTALRTHIEGYEKADRSLAKKLIAEKLEDARQNSAATYKAAQSAGTDDPSTKMHLLVDELEHLKEHKHFQEDRKGCPQ